MEDEKNPHMSHSKLTLAKIDQTFGRFCLQSPFPLQISIVETIDSTNTSLLKEAEEGASQGRVLIAEQQTAGRGRKNRIWESPAYQNLYLSILLTPSSLNPSLTLMTGLSFCKALRNEGVSSLWLKWPNDLWIKNKKIGGILTETSHAGVVVGFGLNVNAKLSDFSEELRPNASSLYLETQKVWDRSELAGKLLASFVEHYKIFSKQGFSSLKKEWEKHSLPRGSRLRIQAVEQTLEGEYQGVTETGALLLKTKTGIQTLIEGDLCFLP